MSRFRPIVAILLLVLTMPLARARAVSPSAAASQRDCCKQKSDACCERSAKACCATQVPANPSVVPSHNVSPVLLQLQTVAVVHTNRIDTLNLHCAAIPLPAEYSLPGLVMVGTTLLRI